MEPLLISTMHLLSCSISDHTANSFTLTQFIANFFSIFLLHRLRVHKSRQPRFNKATQIDTWELWKREVLDCDNYYYCSPFVFYCFSPILIRIYILFIHIALLPHTLANLGTYSDLLNGTKASSHFRLLFYCIIPNTIFSSTHWRNSLLRLSRMNREETLLAILPYIYVYSASILLHLVVCLAHFWISTIKKKWCSIFEKKCTDLCLQVYSNIMISIPNWT